MTTAPEKMTADLKEIAEAVGGTLIVEERQQTLGPLPLFEQNFAHAKCPNCGGGQFWYEFGDTYCNCDGCGREFDVDDLRP